MDGGGSQGQPECLEPPMHMTEATPLKTPPLFPATKVFPPRLPVGPDRSSAAELVLPSRPKANGSR